ncbi:hypothetical protein vseg_020396 [Gypsophila vaccaria]
MSTSVLTFNHLHHPISISQFKLNPRKPPNFSPKSSLSDPFVLQIAETLEDSLPTSSSIPLPLQKLRDSSSESLISLSWPTRKDESFRFTDTSFIKSSQVRSANDPSKSSTIGLLSEDTQFINLNIIDGFLAGTSSGLSGLPDGVYVGTLGDLHCGEIVERVSELVVSFEGDLFWSLNGVGAPDMVVVYVPEGCRVEKAVHLRYCSVSGGGFGSNVMPVSSPRVLVVVEKGGEVGIVEEYVGVDDDEKEKGGGCYWTNSVIEVVVGEGANVSHSYVQTQSLGAAHTKWTAVRQESSSTYKLVEISSGGKLSRHNLHVQQMGPDTVTEVSALHLCINDQTQDLHSRLIFDHPRGNSSQLHKCIVGHPRGQAVFDGNVRVNRYAQQTDAGQLTRSLLLVPQATVNVKPNLQIIADDVKCSHGAAISDLEDDQLFYFLARGIDLETARKALIFSFGSEVIDRIPFASVKEKVKTHISQLLTSAVP